MSRFWRALRHHKPNEVEEALQARVPGWGRAGNWVWHYADGIKFLRREPWRNGNTPSAYCQTRCGREMKLDIPREPEDLQDLLDENPKRVCPKCQNP